MLNLNRNANMPQDYIAEKELIRHMTFELSYESFLTELREYFRDDDAEAFNKKFTEYSNLIEKGIINKNSIVDENSAYLCNANADFLNAWQHNIQISLIYGVAAKRVHDRGETEASFLFLCDARYYLGTASGIDIGIQIGKKKIKKSEQNSINASVPYERFRYKIIGLLEREYSRPGWPNVASALNSIQEHLISYIQSQKLDLDFTEVEEKISTWCKTYPAFKAELEYFLYEA